MCNLHWCYTFCTGVTLFALVLQLNCTALSQSESSNFFMYIIRTINMNNYCYYYCYYYYYYYEQLLQTVYERNIAFVYWNNFR